MLQKRFFQVLVALLVHANYSVPDVDLCLQVKQLQAIMQAVMQLFKIVYSFTSSKRKIIYLSTVFF